MNSARIVRYARRHAGLTQRELATRAGMPQPAVARIECGRVAVRMDTLQRLLATTDMTLEVVPAAGRGVDRTLIRASLALTPEQRVTAAGQAGTNLAAFLTEVGRGPRR